MTTIANEACVTTYATLVRARKSHRACPGLTNAATCNDGFYDSDQIGPWTPWQGKLRAAVRTRFVCPDLKEVRIEDAAGPRYEIASFGHNQH